MHFSRCFPMKARKEESAWKLEKLKRAVLWRKFDTMIGDHLELCVLCLVSLVRGIHAEFENNVCPSLWDYPTMKDNPNCWYDFAAESKVVSFSFQNFNLLYFSPSNCFLMFHVYFHHFVIIHLNLSSIQITWTFRSNNLNRWVEKLFLDLQTFK